MGSSACLRLGGKSTSAASRLLPAPPCSCLQALSCLARLRQRAVHIKQAKHSLRHRCCCRAQAGCRNLRVRLAAGAGGRAAAAAVPQACGTLWGCGGVLISCHDRQASAFLGRPRARPASKPLVSSSRRCNNLYFLKSDRWLRCEPCTTKGRSLFNKKVLHLGIGS